MTPERIRIKVAEAMGWKHPEYGYMQNAWRESNGSWHFGSNVLDDLNACAEFEGALTNEEQSSYAATIEGIVSNAEWVAAGRPPSGTIRNVCLNTGDPSGTADYSVLFSYISATALQRCEAYLRVNGLWEESPTPDKPPLSPVADTHAANKAANHRTGCGDNA